MDTSQCSCNWVEILAAVSTFLAVLVALFGQAFKSTFFPPKLLLSIPNPSGEATKIQLLWIENGEQKERFEDARYYRVRVENKRRWSPAQQAHIVLLKVEEAGLDGQFRPIWSGDIPLEWKHQQLLSHLRSIGPSVELDLCSIVKNKWLQLHPLVIPANLNTSWRDNANIILTIQCRSNEIDSEVMRIQISWDGNWHDGAIEMQRHLIIKTIN